MAKMTFKVAGIQSTIKSKLTDRNIDRDVDKITEAYARKIANEAAAKAPILTGLLRNSLVNGVQRSRMSSSGVWDIIAGTDYVIRQEYEHKSHKGFIRKSVWDNEEAYKREIEKRAKGGGK